MKKLNIAFDAQTHRRYDRNGYLHVTQCHISKEMVYPYWGNELPPEFGLEALETYFAYLPGSVLKEAALSFEGVPLLIDHHDVDAWHPAKEYRAGTVSNVRYRAPYLDADLHITDRVAIDLIESGKMRELSIGFFADYSERCGRLGSDDYQFTIEGLAGNHVALVEEGRAGHDVLVADSRPLDFMAWLLKKGLTLDGGKTKGKEELESQRRYNRDRPKADDFYYSYEWKKARSEYLKDHPMCERCHKSKAVLVDHIKPVSQGGARLAASNLQALCAACHNRKTASQRTR